MTENEREAIEELRDLLEQCNEKEIVSRNLFENIARVLILMEKQENIIKGNECVIETLTNNEKVLLEALEKKDMIIKNMIERVYLKKEEYECIKENEIRKPHKSFEDCILEYFEKKEEG